MHRAVHIIVIIGFAVAFHFVGANVPVVTEDRMTWFHHVLMLPVYLAVRFGDGPHDANATVGYLTWTIQCLVVGVLADLALRSIVRIRSQAQEQSRAK